MNHAVTLAFVAVALVACSDDSATGAGSGGGATTAAGPATSGNGTTGPGTNGSTTGSAQTTSSSSAGGGTPGCAGHDYALCEDFEGANEGEVPAGWIKRHPYTDDPGAVVEEEIGVATDQAHWGAKSLKSSSEECAQTRAVHSLDSLGATAATHWGRIFFRVQTPAPATDPNCNCYYHETFVGLGPSATNESRVVDTVQSPAGQVSYIYNVPDDSFGEGSPGDYTYESVWRCAEWYIDDATDSYRFFLDGQELFSFENEPGAQMEQFSDISVGSICYILPLAPTEFTAWFDDLAIDDERIGCE